MRIELPNPLVNIVATTFRIAKVFCFTDFAFEDIRLVVGVKRWGDWGILRPHIGSIGVIFVPALWGVFDPEGAQALKRVCRKAPRDTLPSCAAQRLAIRTLIFGIKRLGNG